MIKQLWKEPQYSLVKMIWKEIEDCLKQYIQIQSSCKAAHDKVRGLTLASDSVRKADREILKENIFIPGFHIVCLFGLKTEVFQLWNVLFFLHNK